ncbi:hypothetical protein PV325_013274, partial [Microctonus aethiopoides]
MTMMMSPRLVCQNGPCYLTAWLLYGWTWTQELAVRLYRSNIMPWTVLRLLLTSKQDDDPMCLAFILGSRSVIGPFRGEEGSFGHYLAASDWVASTFECTIPHLFKDYITESKVASYSDIVPWIQIN